uniref:Translation initiation factor IF-3, chloroplastic n=1 Tax=Bulboplastis apyrenoidosa TaxID=1070855 RepID=A0A1Y9TM52_9RHOD|nr:translation initiation factor 3 [Bulboplastis apyrenoidosa]ARO90717.1 translation initiation factor 3 [Bulboplastis apyrenoidosa]
MINSLPYFRDMNPAINYQIQFPKVRVIDADGNQLGVFNTSDAIKLAEKDDLDLVMVSEKSTPPVCRILDYGKYKFLQDKRAREVKKKQQVISVKEVKMRYRIEEHDYNVRINQASRFLKSGDKVKAIINFKGREIQHVNFAMDLLLRMAEDLKQYGDIQQSPARDGRNMIMILSPKKVGS